MLSSRYGKRLLLASSKATMSGTRKAIFQTSGIQHCYNKGMCHNFNRITYQGVRFSSKFSRKREGSLELTKSPLAYLENIRDRCIGHIYRYPQTVIYGIIAGNVSVYALLQVPSPSFHSFMSRHFVCSAGALAEHRFHTIFSNIYTHNDFWQLGINMMSLYFFGTELVNRLGAARFLFLYHASGVFASIIYMSFSQSKLSYNASGAIASVISFSVLEWPKKIILINLIIPVPALLFGLLYIFQDVFRPYGAALDKDKTRYGAVAGAAYWVFLKYITKRPFL